jgi:hypothetical protein
MLSCMCFPYAGVPVHNYSSLYTDRWIHKKNGNRRYKYLSLGRDNSYFVRKNPLKSSKYWRFWLTTYMLLLWLPTVFLFSSACSFSRRLVPCLVGLFLYSYEADLMQLGKKLTRSFNWPFRNIYDVLSLSNCQVGDYVAHVYPINLEIKYTTYISRSLWYLDIYQELDNDGLLGINPPDVYGFYQDLSHRWLSLTRKLLHHRFMVVKLKSSLRKFYGYHLDFSVTEYILLVLIIRWKVKKEDVIVTTADGTYSWSWDGCH